MAWYVIILRLIHIGAVTFWVGRRSWETTP